MNVSKKQLLSEIITKTIPSTTEKFTPTCRVCGKKHWPLDPSCIGKKGVKAEARAKAKAERKAKAELERMARAEAKGRAEAEN